MKAPTKLEGALARLDAATLSVWGSLSPAQQRALRDAYPGIAVGQLPRVRSDTTVSTLRVLVKARLVEPSLSRRSRFAKFPNRTLTPTGVAVRAADPKRTR